MLQDFWKLPPPLTEGELIEQNARFDGYLWFRKKGNGREFTCTRCRQTYDVLPLGECRTQTPKEARLLYVDHKYEATCARCGRPGQALNVALMKKCYKQGKLLTYAKIRRESFNEVYVDCYHVAKRYPQGTRLADLPIWDYESTYRLTPEGAEMAVACWGYSSEMSWYNRGKECIDAFLQNEGTCGQYHISYTFSNLEALQDTFLARCGYKEYIGRRRDRVLYFCNVIRYPGIEQLAKAGYRDIIDMWIDGTHFRGKLNMKGASPREIFRLTANECRELLTLQKGENTNLMKEWYRGWDEKYPDFCTLVELVRICGMSKTDDFLNKYDYEPARLLRYLKSQYAKRMNDFENRDIGCHHAVFAIAPTMSDTVQHFYDYLNICRQIDLQAEQYPKDVIAAHDQVDQQRTERERHIMALAAAANRKDFAARMRLKAQCFEAETKQKMDTAIASDKKHAEKLQKLLRRRIKDYTFTDGKYMTVIPKCAVDLVKEGRALHHCVGTYSERFDKGDSDIIFIRRIDAIDKPLLTVEVLKRGKSFTFNQCYGFKDDRCMGPDDVWMQDDYNAWLAIYEPDVRAFAKTFEKYLESKGEQEDGKRARVG